MSDATPSPPASRPPYQPPRLEVLGSVQTLTLQGKTFGSSDGDWLVVTGQGLTNAS